MTTNPVYTKARRHLARRDSVLKGLIAKVGPCTLQPRLDGFVALVRSIISQQISTKAAESIANRLLQTLGPGGISAQGILALTEEQLRGVGLSTAKVRSVRDLAVKVQSGAVPIQELSALEDEEVIAKLVPVRGVGRWTAEMYLIFSLGRLDVLPVGDLGLRLGVQDQYGLTEPPDKATLTELAEPWRPYRSIATWYFWRSRGFVPSSK